MYRSRKLIHELGNCHDVYVYSLDFAGCLWYMLTKWKLILSDQIIFLYPKVSKRCFQMITGKIPEKDWHWIWIGKCHTLQGYTPLNDIGCQWSDDVLNVVANRKTSRVFLKKCIWIESREALHSLYLLNILCMLTLQLARVDNFWSILNEYELYCES